MISTNLAEGYTEFATVQATPPLNTWWEEFKYDTRFYAVSRPAATNTGGVVSTDIDQIGNGGFSNSLTGWLTGTASDGDASFSVVGEEFLADIANGGTLQWHVFLRQADLVFPTEPPILSGSRRTPRPHATSRSSSRGTTVPEAI